MICVYAAASPLKAALLRVLASRFPEESLPAPDMEHQCGVAVVVRDPHTLPLCKDLVARRIPVIVLAPVPTPADKATYAAAGVHAYLPIDLDISPLVVAVASALDRQPGGMRVPEDRP